ncbi:unnamed protein product [Aureobasidium mustum]|uniref:Uncharacterized protein n=1 Tax=Aureobasidium mustum TaxID=2773714 RepID=A0A9N8JWD6_9PEZI|nr:unnamed protein product [Aureobasidium mustum]
MKYTYDIYQWCIYNCCPTRIFLDMDPEALERHSTYFRWLLSHLNTPWHHRSPAKAYKELHLHPLHLWMHEHALRYVFCAINRAKNGKRIFLEIPGDFVLAVRVYQVLLFLQVEECIAPMHGHIRQVIRERPLLSDELEAVWACLSNIAPRVYEFALDVQYERERQVWMLGPGLGEPKQQEDMEVCLVVEEEAGSSGEETVVEIGPDQDTKMFMNDTNTDSDKTSGFTAGDEESDQETEASDEEDQQCTTLIPLRRRSVPTPYSKPMYDIDTSDFRECADEEPEY